MEKRVLEHALMGSKWLLEHQNTNGSWIDLENAKVDAFYKASWALLVTGQHAAAQRALNYTVLNFFNTEGDFIPREHPSHKKVHYLYPNAYFVVGSMIAGRYEIAIPAVDFLLSHQDPDHGGFYSRYTDSGRKNLSDTISTSAAGLACLAAGRIDAARRAGEFLENIVDMQPAPNDRFFTTIQPNGRLCTDLNHDKETFLRIIDVKKENQCWYAIGLPLAFLIQFASATGERRYRDLAQWCFNFQMRCVNPWDGSDSGKAAWGCAMIYRMTGVKRYLEIASYIAENILSKQNSDGSWLLQEGGCYKPDKQAYSNGDFDLTSEYTLWLSLISSNISARA
jgi:hypothetical protein